MKDEAKPQNSETCSHCSKQNHVKHLLVGSVFVTVAHFTLKDPHPGHLGIQGMMGNVVPCSQCWACLRLGFSR